MKIKIITPIVIKSFRFDREEYARRIKRLSGLCEDTEVEFESIKRGPTSIESKYDEVLACPDIMRLIKEAEEDGYDAVVVNCFGDPGVMAGRELVKIPVVGPGEASMLVASSLCHKFSVVTVLKNVVPLIEENAKIYGIYSKLASVRSIDIPVLELHADEERTVKALAEEGRIALEEDGAELLILGCTGMTGLAQRLSELLDVIVIDPLPTALKFAESLVKLGLSHSKRGFPTPPKKERII
ncbi:hydrogenase expression protein HupH [Candidatus Bathyarchaeota archaeon]|nr:MAG: hydrogenase expression protein HupH [Candidatus Bathyarchaeota archaeon]